MTLHKEGYIFLLASGLILTILVGFILAYLPAWASYPLLVLAIAFYGMLVQFFRIPTRSHTFGDNLIIAPADGKVVVIEKVFEPEYLLQDCLQVSIFMSPVNVHQNRVPVSGVLEYYKYHPGLYLVAWHPKSSTENERNTSVVRMANGHKILFRQIAGALAKRICYYLKQGQDVTQNQEFGFIKFGSRVDLFLPLDTQLDVKIGDLTKNGVTVIGKLSA
jgi:phosphatidylserine decarboxylase